MMETTRMFGIYIFLILTMVIFCNGKIAAQSSQLEYYWNTHPPAISNGAWFAIQMEKGRIPTLQAGEIWEESGSTSPLEWPFLVTSFDAINFDQDASLNGAYQIPPDPLGAAGPSHVVCVVNSAIQWYTKTGTLQHSQSLSGFFFSLLPNTRTFDPKVIYDQYADRFVVITLERTDTPDTTSRIFVAVSDDSDPNGTWYFQEIDSRVEIGGTSTWADYPGLAISNEAVYITANMFDFSDNFKASRLWIIDKGIGSGGLYSGGSSTINIYDPSTIVGLGTQEFTMQPAHMFGNPPTGVGTFLVASGWYLGPTDVFNVMRVDDPVGTPSFSQQFVFIGDIHDISGGFPDAPQSSTTTKIETNDSRMLHAVWRNNRLLTTLTVKTPSGVDAGQTSAFWVSLNTTNLNSITVADSGHVGGEEIASQTYTFFPSIATNVNGDIAVGFAASAPSIYPGAYYAARLTDDPAGTMNSPDTLRTGRDYYIRTFGSGRNRWGDYSGICVDPADDSTFWVFNEYALTRGTIMSGEDGRWGTAFGRFVPVATPTTFYADNIQSNSVDLHWNGNSAAFQLKQDGTEIYSGNNTSLTVTGLTENTTYTFTLLGKAGSAQAFSKDSIILEVTTPPSGGSPNPTEAIASTPLMNAGEGTSEFSLPNTGVWLMFPSGLTTATRITAARKSGNPGIVGNLPTGVDRISPDRNWTVSASAGTSVGTYNIRLDLTGVPGITNFNALKILQRPDGSSPWQNVEDLGATLTFNEPYITVNGLTTFSDFAIGGAGGDNPLPVVLSAFSAEFIEQTGSIHLTWETQSEVNTAGFIIERSFEPEENFQTIASFENIPALRGHGNSNQPHSYSFVDNHIEPGATYFYRLMEVDYNYQFNLLKTISVTVPQMALQKQDPIADKFYLYPAYPNPFNPATAIVFSLPSQKRMPVLVELSVFNLIGQKIKTLVQKELSEGVYRITWDGTDIHGVSQSTGMYFIIFRAEAFWQTRKILLMR